MWYYDSFGEVVQANPAAIAVGVYPPPFPSGVQPPTGDQPDTVRRRRGLRMAPKVDDPPPAGYTQPNILLVMVDQMRQEKWFPSGGESAIFNSTILPNITNLRNSSFVFGYHFTAATNCSPARSALLTGLYPQQTCMFKGVQTQNGPTGYPIPVLQTGYETIGTLLSRAGYSCTWIGKWHVSAPGGAPSSQVGSSGPFDYGFSEKTLDIPNLYTTPNAYPSDDTYASPDGEQNEGAGGTDLDNNQIGSSYTTSSPQTFTPSSVKQLRDGAIADAFVNCFFPVIPSTPWFTAVSFVNPHDLSYFPYAYGLSTGDFSPPTTLPTEGYDAPPVAGNDLTNTSANDYIPALSARSPYGTSAPSNYYGVPWNYHNGTSVDDPASLPYTVLQTSGQYGKPGLQAFQENELNV